MTKQKNSFQTKTKISDIRLEQIVKSNVYDEVQGSEMEGVQAPLRVQSVEQEMKRFEQELK